MSELIHDRYYLDPKSAKQLGQWHNGIDVITHHLVTIKLCSKADETNIAKEVTIYRQLAGTNGVPVLCWTGIENEMCVLVLAGASVSLLDLRNLYPEVVLAFEGQVAETLNTLRRKGCDFGLNAGIRVSQYSRVFVISETGGSQDRNELMATLRFGGALNETIIFDLLIDRYLTLYKKNLRTDLSLDQPQMNIPGDLDGSMKLQKQQLQLFKSAGEVKPQAWEDLAKITLNNASRYRELNQPTEGLTQRFARLTERSLIVLGNHTRLSCIVFINELMYIASSLHRKTPSHLWLSLSGHLCQMMARLTASRSSIEKKAWLAHAWSYGKLKVIHDASSKELCFSASGFPISEEILLPASQLFARNYVRCSMLETLLPSSLDARLMISLDRIMAGDCDRQYAIQFLRLLKLNVVKESEVMRKVASTIPVMLYAIQSQASIAEDAQAYLACAHNIVRSLPENFCTSAFIHSARILDEY